MKKIEKVLIMTWGCDLNGAYFQKHKMKFPTEIPITVEYDQKRVVGTGSNFEDTEDGIWCDAVIENNVELLSLAPGFKIEEMQMSHERLKILESELVTVSLVSKHADINCQDNLKKASKNILIVKSITRCARCGQDHHGKMFFEELDRPLGLLTHWGRCPHNGQPILMKITEKEEEKGECT